MIRLYGHLRGSFRTVSEGLKQGFEALGVLEGYLIEEQQEFSSDPIPGALAPIAVVVGDPLRVALAHTQGGHQEIWLMLAPNSEGVPPELKRQLQGKWRNRTLVDGFLAPSTWAKGVLEKEFPNHSVELCPHGVLPAFAYNSSFREDRLQELQGRFVAAHFTSSRLDRKQTRPLIRAWHRLVTNGSIKNASLKIQSNPEFYSELQEAVFNEGAVDSTELFIGQNINYSSLAKLYQSYHCILQPSRAEGFGLVPLEAAACGVPVLVTAGTGHLEYVPLPGQQVIPVGESREMDDYRDSRAPSVAEDDIERGILSLYENYEQLSTASIAAAQQVRHEWRWEHGAAAAVEKWKKKYGPS